MKLMGLDDVGNFSSACAWTTGGDPFAPHEATKPSPPRPRPSASPTPQDARPGPLDTSVDSLDVPEQRSDTSNTSSTLPSPAAQWLGSLNGSFGSPNEPETTPNSLLSHLRRSSSNRPRRPERTPSMTSSFSSLERHSSLGAKRPPRADEEGYVFGPGTQYRLGRAIGFGESSIVFEGTARDVADDSASDSSSSTDAGRRVAIKILRNAGQQPQGVRQNDHELELWLSLPCHPHLLSLIHYERIREPPSVPGGRERVLDHLVMDYSPYGNLLQFVRREGAVVERGTSRPGLAQRPRVVSADPQPPPSMEASSWSAAEHHAVMRMSGTGGHALATSVPPSAETAHEKPILRALSSSRRSRGLPIDVARDIMRQIASGLYSLHKVASVVHCDLKLENVLAFAPEGEPGDAEMPPIAWKIADFGLSEKVQHERRVESWSRAAKLGGTLAYAAPEVVRYIDFDMPVVPNVPSHAPPMTEQMHMPFARDMWSLGCILYALLSGQLPFVDGMQVRLQRKILAGDFEIPARLLTGKERVDLDPPSDRPAEAYPYRSDPALDTDECRMQAREVLENLLELDPNLRWDIDDLCQSPWLALY